jgi:hypothetical protein
MKIAFKIIHSLRLSLLLIILIAASILADHHVYVSAYRWGYDAEKFWQNQNQEMALSNAIEQFWIDCPDATISNNSAFVEQLGGRNPKNIRYLKTERYPRDSAGRLLDADGLAYVIKVDGTKFYLCAPECVPEMQPAGDRENPHYRRSN